MFSDDPERGTPISDPDHSGSTDGEAPAQAVQGSTYWPDGSEDERRRRWQTVQNDGELMQRVATAMRARQAGADGKRWVSIERLTTRVFQSWAGVLAMEPVAKRVQPKNETHIQDHYARLRDAAEAWSSTVIISSRGATGLEPIAKATNAWIKQCFDFALTLDAAGQFGFFATPLSWKSGLGVARLRVEAQAIQAEAATLAMALSNLHRLALAGPEAEAAEPQEKGDAARQRRLRARRRQGMIGRISVSLYRHDIQMLRALGLLPPGETTREQQEEALEAFLLFSALGRHDPGVSWEARALSQTGRLVSFGLAEGRDED